jgi:hypothetical protein
MLTTAPGCNVLDLYIRLGLGANDQMDHAVRRGDEEAVEVLAQLLNLIAPRHTMHFQNGRRGFRVVCFQLQPDVRMTQVWDFVDPETVRAELENAAVLFFFD